MCDHKKIWKDGVSAEGNPFKYLLCKECGEVSDMVVKEMKRVEEEEKKQTVWDLKDLRITRMSVLKPATELSIAANDYSLENVIELAEAMEKWVYRTT